MRRLALAAFLAFGAPAGAEAPAEPVLVPRAEVFPLVSTGTGRRYRVFLLRPALPAPEAGYPVIYYLDGNATFLTAAEAVRLQTRAPKGFGPAAVVAVGYETEEAFDTTARYFDFTTPAEVAALPVRGNGEPYPERGGADAFLRFFEADLFPAVAARLAADPERRALVGHSLGGYFTLHAFLTRPELFETFVAGSPSAWWNEGEILGRARDFAAAPPDLAGKRLFIGVGAEEIDHMVAEAGEMAAILAPLSAGGLRFGQEAFAGEEHITVLPALVSRSVRVALEP